MSEAKVSGALTREPDGTFDGQPVAVVRGDDPVGHAPETLYISTRTTLPVGLVEMNQGVTIVRSPVFRSRFGESIPLNERTGVSS